MEPQKEQRSAIGLRGRTNDRQMLRGLAPAVSSLSAAIPYAASRRTAVPGSVTLLSRADVVPCRAAKDLAKGRAWPDTEEVTGSNPVAPTHKTLTSGNAGQFAVRGRFRDLCTGWRAFPLLNLPVHGPTRPAPAHSLLRAAPVRREPLGPNRHHLSHGRAAGRHLPARRGTSLEAATRGDLEAFLGDLLSRRKASTAATYHKVLKILYGWLAEEEEIPANPMAKIKKPIVPNSRSRSCPRRPSSGSSRPTSIADGTLWGLRVWFRSFGWPLSFGIPNNLPAQMYRPAGFACKGPVNPVYGCSTSHGRPIRKTTRFWSSRERESLPGFSWGDLSPHKVLQLGRSCPGARRMYDLTIYPRFGRQDSLLLHSYTSFAGANVRM